MPRVLRALLFASSIASLLLAGMLCVRDVLRDRGTMWTVQAAETADPAGAGHDRGTNPNRVYAQRSRADAVLRIRDRDFGSAEFRLMEAKRIDPDGEYTLEVEELWREVHEGLGEMLDPEPAAASPRTHADAGAAEANRATPLGGER
jgi:hypothetical protein